MFFLKLKYFLYYYKSKLLKKKCKKIFNLKKINFEKKIIKKNFLKK